MCVHMRVYIQAHTPHTHIHTASHSPPLSPPRSPQVNHLGHFLLTLELLPLITSSAPDVRVVIVSSVMHKWSNPFDPNNLEGEQNYNRFKQYGSTKLFNVSQHKTHKLTLPYPTVPVWTVFLPPPLLCVRCLHQVVCALKAASSRPEFTCLPSQHCIVVVP